MKEAARQHLNAIVQLGIAEQEIKQGFSDDRATLNAGEEVEIVMTARTAAADLSLAVGS
jgi:hypothetical protein